MNEPDIEREEGVIYTDKELIDTCFSDEHILSRPLPIFIIMDEPSRLVDIINGHGGLFMAEMHSTSIQDKSTTIVLHKVSDFDK